MTSSTTSTDPRLTLSITGRNLPINEDELESLLEHLETAATRLLAETNTDADIESWIGQFYATVEPICPACGNDLKLESIHLGTGGGAFAIAFCTADCGWSGDAKFRVIDLDRKVGETDFESVVAGQAIVNNCPSTDSESYDPLILVLST